MDIKAELHRMIDEMDDYQASVAHDYLFWWLSQKRDVELTAEEQAAVDHNLAIIRTWMIEDGPDRYSQAAEDEDDESIMFWDNGDGIIDSVDFEPFPSNGQTKRKHPDA
jgi:hypothetical protein